MAGSWWNFLEQRYSPLNQINKNTVPRLSPVWHHQFDDARGLEATPLSSMVYFIQLAHGQKSMHLMPALGN